MKIKKLFYKDYLVADEWGLYPKTELRPIFAFLVEGTLFFATMIVLGLFLIALTI